MIVQQQSTNRGQRNRRRYSTRKGQPQQPQRVFTAEPGANQPADTSGKQPRRGFGFRPRQFNRRHRKIPP